MQAVILEGREFPIDEVSSLVRGDTAARVRELLGEPLSITSLEEGSEEWRYFMRSRRPRSVHILRLQFAAGSEVLRSEAILRMQAGRLAIIGKFEPGTPE